MYIRPFIFFHDLNEYLFQIISNLVVHISGNIQNSPSFFFSAISSRLMFTGSDMFTLSQLSDTPATMSLT